jgi:LuxR family transcriptional regulator, maltose regulon positive regulatory protein
VAKPSDYGASGRLGLGWTALRDGRWDAARTFFAREAAAGAGAEAFEGLSWAAWWVDDEAVVFDARERAYRLYRRESDPAGAARMATWLACDELDFHGAWAVANGWLARAHRLVDTLEPCADHGWLAFMEGYFAHAAGNTATAAELATRAIDLGRRFGAPDLEMLGLALEGATLVACARVRDGMRCLDEATASAMERDAEIPISSAWACCLLVSACMAVRDYDRASAWCDRIAEFAERYGSRYMLAFCRAEYGAVDLWRGRWAEAEAVLTASLEDFSRSRPAWATGPTVGLAELRRRQGRVEDAVALLDRVGPSSAGQLCSARIALDAGRALRASELVERALRQVSEARMLDRAPGLELLVHTRLARGDLDAARDAVAALRTVAERIGTPALAAGADLAEGMLAAAGGEHEAARTLLEDAVDGFERSGGAYEAALARVELATALIALGRCDAAEGEAAAALDVFERLGAAPAADRARRVVRVSSRVTASATDSADAVVPLAGLTPREREVLCLLADGLTNPQIAKRLVVSEHTVHRHVANILRKLDLPTRTAAAARAVSAGLVEVSGSWPDRAIAAPEDGPHGRSRRD